ncbi:MAG: glycosyltransferase family 2 protein [Lachnospiraceae bacterium]|nr:glycosyltransferase family 2 protein [Lachnospiraceae bacterium]
MKQDLVSIVTPVYCAQDYIEETLNSVVAQSYPHLEHILVVDGAQDPTIPYIRQYMEKHPQARIRLVVQETNQGAAHARNRGVEEAMGRYIAYIDADDVWRPDKLAKQLEFMEKTGAGFCFSSYEFGDENAKGTGKVVRVPETISYRQALKNTTIFTSTVVFDTERIPKEEIRMPIIKSEDTALWWKILRAGRQAHGLDENLVTYRRPAKSLSSNKLEAVRRIWNLYRKAEGMSVPVSIYYFCFWAVTAVYRRI